MTIRTGDDGYDDHFRYLAERFAARRSSPINQLSSQNMRPAHQVDRQSRGRLVISWAVHLSVRRGGLSGRCGELLYPVILHDLLPAP